MTSGLGEGPHRSVLVRSPLHEFFRPGPAEIFQVTDQDGTEILSSRLGVLVGTPEWFGDDFVDQMQTQKRITSYNVCYTKLLLMSSCHSGSEAPPVLTR